MNYIFDKNINIYDKIRIYRIAKGYTQEYVADKLKIDTVNYGRIERGQAKITIDRLIIIAEILDIKVIDFFSDLNCVQEQDIFLQKIYETEINILEELKILNNKIN